MAGGYDISASGSSSSATGAQEIKPTTFIGIGGSIGLSWNVVAVVVGAVVVWLLLFRKK